MSATVYQMAHRVSSQQRACTHLAKRLRSVALRVESIRNGTHWEDLDQKDAASLTRIQDDLTTMARAYEGAR